MNWKKGIFATLSLTLIVFSLLAFACPAWSYSVNGVDVGNVDYFVSSTELGNSGDAGELAWVNTVLDPDFAGFVKTETSGGAGWRIADGQTRVYAFDFKTDAPEYFLVKTGNLGQGQNNLPDTFLFRNDASFGWAVVNLGYFGSGVTVQNIGKLSHIDEFGNRQVPEPATLIFLGFGLVGIGAAARRKMMK